jgi:hypothetical protein
MRNCDELKKEMGYSLSSDLALLGLRLIALWLRF